MIVIVPLFLLVALLAWFLANAPMVRGSREGMNDILFAWTAGDNSPLPAWPDRGKQMTTVAVDDVTWDGRWRATALGTPPSRLAELIAAVSKSGPAYIVVDIDLGYDNEDPAGRDQGRAMLRQVLSQPGPPILLVRPERTKPRAGEFRETFIDDLVDGPAGIGRLYWFSPGFRIDEDGMTRWLMGATIGYQRTSRNRPRVTLSAGLIIRLRESGPAGRRLAGALSRGLAGFDGKGACPLAASLAADIRRLESNPPERGAGAWLCAAARDPDRTSRVAFPYENIWRPEACDRKCDDKKTCPFPDRVERCRAGTTIARGELINVSAATVLRSPDRRPELIGKIVLIGRTDSGTDDLWRTAIAPDLPGVGLLAESIYTVRSLDRPLREDWLTKVLTIMLALPFLLMQALLGPSKLHWLGLLVAGAIGVFAAMCLLLRFGIWLDLSLPLFVVAVTSGLVELIFPYLWKE
ncbi:MAG: CHASE2 domain-containing protein [Pseudomonadota bacterium]